VLLLAPAIVDAERLPARVFTTADGLANNGVKRIVHDSRGYLWFCTREGLSRFDGHGFTTYTVDEGLPSAVVNDLVETREGIAFDDGSVLLVEESVVGVITHGDSTGFLEITQTIAGGTGRFEGATGSGTGVVNLNSGAVIIASGTITLAEGDN
jgi:ligand-binding sensor domain-containing protein